MAVTRAELFAHLDKLGLAHSTVEHEPLHTVEESQDLYGRVPGGHAKNLFVKDKKSRLFLISLRANATIDLKKVHETIGASGRVSFCSADQLWEHLGLRPGSVTPFGAINDTAGAVTVILEKTLMEMTPVNFHPLENTATTSIAPADLISFLNAINHAPTILDLPTTE
nr:YbaK/EbsC family protein [Oryzibacter oryziterrae]